MLLQFARAAWKTISAFVGKSVFLWIALSAPLCAVQMLVIVAVVSIPFVFSPASHRNVLKLDVHTTNKKPLSRRSLSLIIFACLVFIILPTILIIFGHLLLVCAVHKISPHFDPAAFHFLSSAPRASAVDAYVHKSVSTRIRSTRHGVLRGLLYQFSNENWGQLNATDVEVYLGIRYAAAPIGDFRFMPPSSSPSWTGVMNATEFGPACPQQVPNVRHLRQSGQMPRARLEQMERLTPFLQNQSEDCLFLNIYTPVLTHNDLSPVVIFIHGESSYEWNTGNAYDGSVLSSYAHVVVITFNFRLGVLGYLSTGDDASRGNYALMDMLAAITWVRDNINVFGGDPSRMTLMGHDSGAASASLLTSLPQTLSSSSSSSGASALGEAQQTSSSSLMQRRAAAAAAASSVAAAPSGKSSLFQRVILISGSAHEPSAMSYNPVIYAKIIAEQFSCPTNVMRELVNCLQGLSVADILQAQSTIRVPRFLTAFGPVVDGYFITKPPAQQQQQLSRDQLDNSNAYCRFGMLFGLTPNVGMKYMTEEDFQRNSMDAQRQQRVTRTMVRNLFTYHMEEIYQAINFEYASTSSAGGGVPSSAVTSSGGDSIRHQQIRDQIVNLLGDALAAAPLVKAGSLHSSQCGQQYQPNNYFYIFNHRSQPARSEDKLPSVGGESLDFQDELGFVFGAPLLKNSILSPFPHHMYTERDAVVSQGMMMYFGNFLATGDPTKTADHAIRQYRQTLQRPTGTSSVPLTTSVPLGRSHIHRRFIENVSWPPFVTNTSTIHQQQYGTRSNTNTAEGAYMSISFEPAVRSQYRSHYMQFWNDLVPQLNSADDTFLDNGQEISSSVLSSFNHHNSAHTQHHLLPNFEDMSTYEGTVLPAAHILTAVQLQYSQTRSPSLKRTAGMSNAGEDFSSSLPIGDSLANRKNISAADELPGFPSEKVNYGTPPSNSTGVAAAGGAALLAGLSSNSTTDTSFQFGSFSFTVYGAAAIVAGIILCLVVCMFMCLRKRCKKCCGGSKKNAHASRSGNSNEKAITAFSGPASKQPQQKLNQTLSADSTKSATLPNHYGNNIANHAVQAKLLANDMSENSLPNGGPLYQQRDGRLINNHRLGTSTLPTSATVRNQMTIAAPSLTMDWPHHNHINNNNRASVYATTANGTLLNGSAENQLKNSFSLPGNNNGGSLPQQNYWPTAANYLLNSNAVNSDNNAQQQQPRNPHQHYEHQQGLVGARIAASSSTAPLCLLRASRSQHQRISDHDITYAQHGQYLESTQNPSAFNHPPSHPTTIATVNSHWRGGEWSVEQQHTNNRLTALSNGNNDSFRRSQMMNGGLEMEQTRNNSRTTVLKPNGSASKSRSTNDAFQQLPPPPLDMQIEKADQNHSRGHYGVPTVNAIYAASNGFRETDFDNGLQQRDAARLIASKQQQQQQSHHKVQFSKPELNGSKIRRHQQQSEQAPNSQQRASQTASVMANGLHKLSDSSDARNAAPTDKNNNVDDTDETAV